MRGRCGPAPIQSRRAKELGGCCEARVTMLGIDRTPRKALRTWGQRDEAAKKKSPAIPLFVTRREKTDLQEVEDFISFHSCVTLMCQCTHECDPMKTMHTCCDWEGVSD